MNIALDFDGVLCDTIPAFCRYHRCEHILKNWPKGEYNVLKVTGHTFEAMPQDFWANLPETPEFKSILGLVSGHSVYFITRFLDMEAARGKFSWILKRFKGMPLMFCETLKVNFFDEKNVILLDDCEEECEAWGETAILMPRPWNHAEIPNDFNEYLYFSIIDRLKIIARQE